MNLFASREFLDPLARVYFPSRECLVEDHLLEGKVFRLLTIAGRPLTTHPFLDMHEPVAASNDSPRTTVRWLPNVDRATIPLDEFRRDPAWQRFSGAPTTLWRDFPAWSDYLDLLRRRRVLGDDQRRRRRLEERVGAIAFTADDAGADVLPTVFTWKSTRLRRLAGTDLFAQPEHRAFFHELRARRLLLASTLRADDRLLAAWLGAVFDGRWYGWIFAFDPDPALARYSVGRQLLYPLLEASYRAGHREFDFSGGCEPYKLFFATHVRVIGGLGTPPVPCRLRSMLRDGLRRTPRAYERINAVRRVVQREVLRVRYHLPLRRSGASAA